MIRLIAIADLDIAESHDGWLSFISAVDAVGSGEVALQIRAHSLGEAEFDQAAAEARDVAKNTLLILNGSNWPTAERIATEFDYNGLHYPEHRISPGSNPGLARFAAVYSSEAAVRAEAAGIGSVIYSPVFDPSSGDGSGVGLGALARLCEATPLAVYALGGITGGRVGSCFAAGAAGVAVLGGLMRAVDPALEVETLLAQ